MKRQSIYEVVRTKDGQTYDDYYFNSRKAAERWAKMGESCGFKAEICQWPVFTAADI